MDARFIIHLHGKEVVLMAGLLDAGHQSGLLGIETQILQELSNPEKQFWVVQAIGRFRSAENGEAIWSAVGDASPESSQMRGAYLRHAETRAIARMLRFATNIGMTAAEELGHEETTAEPSIQRPARPAGPVRHEAPAGQAMTAADVGSCEVCHGAVSKNERTASQHHFRRDLCRTHFAALRQQAEAQNQPTTA